jgi:hypothetical protein
MIGSTLSNISKADKMSVNQLAKAVQDGTLPAYIGVPLIDQKKKEEQKAQGAQAMGQPKPPTIVEKIMAPAAGVDQLASGLPETEQAYADGGIVAFSEGGDMAKSLLADEDPEDDDFIKALLAGMELPEDEDMPDAVASFKKAQDEASSYDAFGTPVTATRQEESFARKAPGEKPVVQKHETKAVSGPAGLEDLLSMIKQKESGGRRYDSAGNLLTSPKGALGEMQVMPGTIKDPGFGIRPADLNNPDDIARVGREYFEKMLGRYQDPKLASIAYNWGPGNTDKWLSAGADPKKLPAETRNYVANMAEGGITGLAGGGAIHFQNTGLVQPAGFPYNIDPRGVSAAAEPATAPAKLYPYDLSPAEIKAEAEKRLKMQQARAALTPAAAAPAEAAAVEAPSLLQRLGSNLSSAATRFKAAPTGLSALLFSGDLNSNEAEELARRRKLPPEITTPGEVLKPMAPPDKTLDNKPRPPMRPITSPSATQTTASQMEQQRLSGIEAMQKNQEEEGFGRGEMDYDEFMKTLPQAEPKKEAAVAADPFAEILGDLKSRKAGLAKDKEINNYLALLSTGLGIMGGRSQYAAENISAGGQKGIQTLMALRGQTAADENSILSGQLGLAKYGSLRDIQKQNAQYRDELGRARIASAEGIAEDKNRTRLTDMMAHMEKNAVSQAQAAVLAQIKANPLLSMDSEKQQQLLTQAEAAARAKLNMNPMYRRLSKQVFPGYDPAELDIPQDIADIMNKSKKQ